MKFMPAAKSFLPAAFVLGNFIMQYDIHLSHFVALFSVGFGPVLSVLVSVT